MITNRSQNDYEALDEGQEAHWEVVQRILFIYAKLNPGQGYVQGMNEIIGPIYYIMASNQNIEEKGIYNSIYNKNIYILFFVEHAEADSFFCFTLLMSEIRDFFIKTLDNSETGINFMMCKLTEILKIKAPNIHNLLMEQEIHSQYFSFRWITLLLSQEFSLPDVVRIWDALFADANRFEFLIKICCCMIVSLEKDILQNDFSSNVKLLQNFPPIDVNLLLSKAVNL